LIRQLTNGSFYNFNFQPFQFPLFPIAHSYSLFVVVRGLHCVGLSSDGLSVVGTFKLVKINSNKLVILTCQVLRYINILMGKLFQSAYKELNITVHDQSRCNYLHVEAIWFQCFNQRSD